jgi:hypothetical protein
LDVEAWNIRTAAPVSIGRWLALDALLSHPPITMMTLVLFVCNKLFNFNRNIRPHCFLEAGHVTKELLLGLSWLGRPPITNKYNCARVNRGLADRLAAEATLVLVLECCHTLRSNGKALRRWGLGEPLRLKYRDGPNVRRRILVRSCYSFASIRSTPGNGECAAWPLSMASTATSA